VKKSAISVRTDAEPTPRLLRALREPDRDLIKLGSLDEAKAWSRRVYERACKKQKV
jgi:hypothetical protein